MWELVLDEIVGLVKLFLPTLGAVIGAFLGSYLASYWTERRRLIMTHWEDLKSQVLTPLRKALESSLMIINDRTTERSPSWIINLNYSPTWRDNLLSDVDRKLYDISLTGHFPSLANDLRSFDKNLQDYDEKYINLAKLVQGFLIEQEIPEGEQDFYLYAIMDKALVVPEDRLIAHHQRLPANFEEKLEQINSAIKKSEASMKRMDELQKEIMGQSAHLCELADKIISEIEDLQRQLKLNGNCRYCKHI